MTRLSDWIRSINGHSSCTDKPLTHTKMSGGKYYIPESEYEEFQRLYSIDSDNGIRTTLSEIKSEHAFKLFFDIDMLDFQEISSEYILSIGSLIQKQVKKYFVSGEDLTYVIATTQTKSVTKDETEYVKNGIHIIYPNLFVNKDMALQIRYTVVLKLESEFGEREIKSNPWSDVIDCAPYSNGLKMVFSVKVVRCEDCKDNNGKQREELNEIVKLRKKVFRRDDKDFDYRDLNDLSKNEFMHHTLSDLIFNYTTNNICNVCDGKKRVLENRYYKPEFVIQDDGSNSEYYTNMLKKSTFEAVKMTSIRCKSNELLSVNYNKPVELAVAPGVFCMKNLSSRVINNSKLKHDLLNNVMFPDDAETLVTWKGNKVYDKDILAHIQVMTKTFDSRYKDISVKDVLELATRRSKNNKFSNINQIKQVIEVKNVYKITVAGDGSNYCINKGDYHNSCTCYFIISDKGIRQKCFSKKDKIRDGGGVMCHEYSSSIKPLSPELRQLLFPGSNDINNKSHLNKYISNGPNKRAKKEKSNWDGLIL